MNHIKQQIKQLENVPATQPWVSYKRVQDVKALKGSFPTLKVQLKVDLILLKSQLRDLDRKRIAVRVQAAARFSRNNEKELEKKLKDAEKDGCLSEKLWYIRSPRGTVS